MKMNLYYKIIFLQIILIFIYNDRLFSQEIVWENISLGPSVSYLMFTEDLGSNWENSPAIGGVINYKIHSNVSVIAEGLISKFNAKKENLPEIVYLGLIGGIKYSSDLVKNFSILFSGGIQSNSFEFEEQGEHQLEDNSSESEFGVFIGTGIGSTFINEIPLEINLRYQSIFTKPTAIKIISISLSVFIL